MTTLGTPFSPTATKVLLLGAGELGKELAIELIRLGVEVIACDAYPDAPAMQVAQKSHVVNMLDPHSLRAVIEKERPTLVMPEIEAIDTATLLLLESEGVRIIPNARAVDIAMNREKLRNLASHELGLKTSRYAIVSNETELKFHASEIGFPCVVKPVMSSSGKGQSVVKDFNSLENAWEKAAKESRGKSDKVIVEEYIDFDFEITLLTVRTVSGTKFCSPIGHCQKEGDYCCSWQPHPITETILKEARNIALKITDALGGFGIFGVELFVRGDEVFFNEVSPRPHDTGMVTMISQNLSEFALHVRAALQLPVNDIYFYSPSASRAIVVEGDYGQLEYLNIEKVIEEPGTDLRLFGKPNVHGSRRMGVILACADTVQNAILKTERALNQLRVR